MMEDKKKIVAELHHKRQEKNEIPTLFGKKVPVISSVYDPLTGMRDGTITANAPVVITGENLCLSSLGTIYLGLSPVSDKGTLIHVKRVFKYTDTEVLVILPELEPGEYSPVMMIHTGGEGGPHLYLAGIVESARRKIYSSLCKEELQRLNLMFF